MDGLGFHDQPFLSKEAAGRWEAGQNALRAIGGFFRRDRNNPKGFGQMVTNVEEQVGKDKGRVNLYDTDEVVQQMNQDKIDSRTGGMFTDLGIGAINFLSPKSWNMKEKTDQTILKSKNFLENIDTKLATPLAGDDPTSMRGKLFSVPTGDGKGIKMGEIENLDGTKSHLYKGTGEDRRPSLIAPVQNATKMATPFLAAMYVGEKVLGQPPNQTQQFVEQQVIPPVQQKLAFTATDYLQKVSATEIEEDGMILQEERLVWEMDKQAHMDKIAQLEDQLEKYAEKLESLETELQLMTKEASEERSEKEKVRADLRVTQNKVMEKTAELEELRLRTTAKERSKFAVQLAEEMLELGLIKQAQLHTQIDKLMECDEESFNLYNSMVKEAKNDEEGLESLAYLVDYRSNEMDSAPAPATKGMSKRGQTVGEAARDLLRR